MKPVIQDQPLRSTSFNAASEEARTGHAASPAIFVAYPVLPGASDLIVARLRPVLHQLRASALLVMLGLAGSAVAADDPIPPKSQRATEIRLTGETVTLPLVMVGEFPFVEGSIAGVTGKLMLDTGIQPALTVNDHRVPIAAGRTANTGRFGSGQTFVVRLAPELRDIRIGGLRYLRATFVQTQDARQLETITPDFIGWFGHDAWATRALKLDYKRLRATFYAAGESIYLKNERVIADLPFETRKLPNHPIMAAKIGDMAVITAWDTGQYGTLFTSEAGKVRLLKEGRLTPSRTDPDAFDLHGFTINGRSMPDVPSISVETTPFAAAAPIGISEPDILTVGYGFLRQYKTVWDYRRRHIYLLARD